MAEYNGTNMVFESEEEQLIYEINSLIKSAKDPQFKAYLEKSLDEIKDYQNPMKLRDKVVENYKIYVQRMNRSERTVDAFYHHAIYGNMGNPEVKSPYSNDIGDNPYSNNDTSPYSNSPELINKERSQGEQQKNPITRTIGYVAGLIGLHALLYIVGYSLIPFVDNKDTFSVAFFNILFIIITGVVLFIGNTMLTKLLDNKISLIVGFAFALLLAGIFVTWNQAGAIITVVTMIGSFTPLYNRKRKIAS